MIDRIEIAGCSSYGESVQSLDGLRAVNFIYGPNAAGKTTLSRVIVDASEFSKCAVFWDDGQRLQTLVYNRDFVRENFSEDGKLKGIFTLGKQDIDVQAKIAKAKLESDGFLAQIVQLKGTLEGRDGDGGKRGELSAVENKFRDECWKLKQQHGARLKDSLRGVLHDKQAFKQRLVAECGKASVIPLKTQSELEQRSASLYGTTPTTEAALPAVQYAAFRKWSSDPILKRRIVGKSDVDIAAIIQKLGNSDWVKQGVPYLATSGEACPFCQQKVPDQLKRSLEEYFDESYLRDTGSLNAVEAGYRLEGERLQQTMQQLVLADSRFLDKERLAAEKNVFDARFSLNLQRIVDKVREPSMLVSLEPLSEVLQTLNGIVAAANAKIKAHNDMVDNLAAERDRLSKDVWAFFAHSEIVEAYERYCTDRSAVQKAIEKLCAQIAKAQEGHQDREEAIRRLEKTITSIQPTVSEINRLLRGFGFSSFYLKATKENFYRLCRHDGSDAQDTLSEGERSFITFLYFFHLLKGSTNEAGLNTDRVVVFDDPVSSLDSDVLFIVSSLIKQAIEEARAQAGTIKQVFLLTHNVYFFKEVVFDGTRSGDAPQRDETFWVVRKVNDVSRVKRYMSIPIKTSYELMWVPLRQPDLADQSLQNNMRRILEHYFRILGGVSIEQIVDKFDGEEKLICRSLVSWVHDGSHSIPDDFFHTLDESAMRRYIAVFRNVFMRFGHTNHYNMMMGLPYSFVTEA